MVATAAGRGGLAQWDPQSLANWLWAFSSTDRPVPKLVPALCSAAARLDQGTRFALDRFNPTSLVTLLWGVAQQISLEPAAAPDRAVAAALTSRAAELFRAPNTGLNPSEIGLLAWAVVRGDLPVNCASTTSHSHGGADGGCSSKCVVAALLDATRETCAEMHWRAIAHVELLARSHGILGHAASSSSSTCVAGGNDDVLGSELALAVDRRMSVLLADMEAASDFRNAAPANLFLEWYCKSAATAGKTQLQIDKPTLVVGDDPGGRVVNLLAVKAQASLPLPGR